MGVSRMVAAGRTRMTVVVCVPAVASWRLHALSLPVPVKALLLRKASDKHGPVRLTSSLAEPQLL